MAARISTIASAGLSIDRKSRLFMLHETLLDRAFASINSEEIRGLVYDGEEMSVPGQTTFIQADAEDWGAYGKECNRVAAMLPQALTYAMLNKLRVPPMQGTLRSMLYA